MGRIQRVRQATMRSFCGNAFDLLGPVLSPRAASLRFDDVWVVPYFKTGRPESIWYVSHKASTLTRPSKTYDEAIQAHLKELVSYAHPSRMLHRRQRILDHKLDVEIRPDLLQNNAQIVRFGIGEHDEFQPCRRLVVVKLVVASAVRYEAAAQVSLSGEVHGRERGAGAYTSSSPPSRFTMFRNEKMVPKISFASSSLESAFRAPGMASPLLVRLAPD